MGEFRTVHQCLFCQQTFDSAADKDDHILEHFAQVSCTECNGNLIRIGGHLYVRHNESTCIKKVAISEENVESCMAIEPFRTTPKPLKLVHDKISNSKNSMALDTANTPQIKTEPKDFDESMSATSGSEMMSPILVDGLSIQKRFPNINLNPVVVLEDILKKTATMSPPESKRCKTENEPYLYTVVRPEIQNYRCNTCSLTFKREGYLVDHMRIHTGEKPYKCTYAHCKERFRTQSHKNKHVLSKHSNDKTSVCRVNGRESFSTEGSLELHIDKEDDTPTTNYPCYICSKVFNMKMNLVKHIEEEHETIQICNVEEQPIEHTQPQQEQSIIASYQEEDNLNGVEFEIKEEQLLIELDANEQPSQQDDSRAWDNTFPTQNGDKYNKVPYHANNEEFICKICGRKFSAHASLQTHVRTKHGPDSKTFKCETCGISCAHGRDLQMHIDSVHSNNRKHKCNTCGKLYKTNSHLKVHILIHTGERPFECSYEQCGKRFTTQLKKVQHERVHTGERPYVCEYYGCGMAFGANRYLKLHRSKVHGISKLSYSCGICKKLFKSKMNLLKHIQEKHLTLKTQKQLVGRTRTQHQQNRDSNHQDDLYEMNFEIKVE